MPIMSGYLVHIEHLSCCSDRHSDQELCNVLHLHREVDTRLYTKCVQDKLLVITDQITSSYYLLHTALQTIL